MSEYINLITLSALAVTLFLGGWHGPWLPTRLVPAQAVRPALLLHLDAHDAPALRYDQLMRFGWKVCPVATINAVTALLVVWI